MRLRCAIGTHADALAVLLVAAVALALRLAFLYRAPVFLTGDSQSHFLPGYDLAMGFGFDPELRRTPGYAFFVAATIGLLGEELRGLAFAQHVVGALTAVLTCVLGRLVLGPLIGLVAGLLVALDGALILSEHSVMTESLFGMLLMGTLVALAASMRTRRRRWLLATGALLGLATLVRPVGQILVPIVPVALVVAQSSRNRERERATGQASSTGSLAHAPSSNRPSRLKSALAQSLVVGIGFAVVVGPWMARNFAEHGSLTASGGLGRSLVARTIKYDFGYFERDRPVVEGDLKSAVRQYVRGKRNTIRNSRSVRSTQAGLMKELGFTQAQADGLMRQVALDEIAERPGYYALGSLSMAWQIVTGKEREDALSTRWNQRTDKDWIDQWEARLDHLVTPTSPSEQRELGHAEALVNLYQPAELGALMPGLALVGIAATLILPPLRPALPIGLAAVALVLASAALDGPVPRYRYPVDPLIALLAAGGVAAIGGVLGAALTRAPRTAALSAIGLRARNLLSSRAQRGIYSAGE